MKPTEKEIDAAIRELAEAMHESVAADKAREDAETRRIRAHKRLLLARDEIRSISFR